VEEFARTPAEILVEDVVVVADVAVVVVVFVLVLSGDCVVIKMEVTGAVATTPPAPKAARLSGTLVDEIAEIGTPKTAWTFAAAAWAFAADAWAFAAAGIDDALEPCISVTSDTTTGPSAATPIPGTVVTLAAMRLATPVKLALPKSAPDTGVTVTVAWMEPADSATATLLTGTPILGAISDLMLCSTPDFRDGFAATAA
jgi:hypothetical protein